jgi:hypothetical protein
MEIRDFGGVAQFEEVSDESLRGLLALCYLEERAGWRLWLQMVQSRSCVINLALASSRS